MKSTFLPNLLIIGAGKAGSTLIWDILRKHPDIEMSRVKEPDFFSVTSNWERGLNWYRTNFNNSLLKYTRYLGEASNSYSAIDFYPHTIQRILSVMNDVKILYTVRNPCRRIESDWMESVLTNPSSESFSSYLRNHHLSAAKNRYLTNYCAYSNAFGSQNIHVIFFEELLEQPSIVLSQLYHFLDLQSACPSMNFLPEPQGATSGSLRVPSFARSIRSSRFYNSFSRLFPDLLRKPVLKLISKKKNVSRPVWSTLDLEYFKSTYFSQSLEFLALHGRDSNLWPFSCSVS
jgi:hypothetical protein